MYQLCFNTGLFYVLVILDKGQFVYDMLGLFKNLFGNVGFLSRHKRE